MSEFTDNDIPICCAECSPDAYFQGYDAMLAHILQKHKNYSHEEAPTYAEHWMHSAYERVEEEAEAYTYEQKLRLARGKI